MKQAGLKTEYRLALGFAYYITSEIWSKAAQKQKDSVIQKTKFKSIVAKKSQQ